MRFIRSIVLLALLLTALPAAAGNLVGTWIGRFTCTIEDADGRTRLQARNSTLTISQPGGAGTSPLRLLIDDGTGGLIQYTGSIVPSAGDPTREGVGAFVACGTSDSEAGGSFSEIELIRWRVDAANGRGSIRKVGVFVESGTAVGACQGAWARTSVVDPGIGACP